MQPSLLHIFWSFLKAGGLTVGNGYAMIHPLRTALTQDGHWMEKDEFDRHLAIIQTIPGIFNVNLAAYMGHRLGGWMGCIAALLGTVLPPFLIFIVVAQFYDRLRELSMVHSFLLGARPAIIALLILPCFKILNKSSLSLSTIWIPIGAAIAIVLLGVSPVYIIAGFTLIGIIYAIQVLMHDH